MVDGHTLMCNKMISDFLPRLNTYAFNADFYVVDIGGIDIVLGLEWLHTINDIYLSTQKMEIRFIIDGQPQLLKVIRNEDLKKISVKRMQHLVCHDNVIDWAVECKIMPTLKSNDELDYHPNIQ